MCHVDGLGEATRPMPEDLELINVVENAWRYVVAADPDSAEIPAAAHGRGFTNPGSGAPR